MNNKVKSLITALSIPLILSCASIEKQPKIALRMPEPKPPYELGVNNTPSKKTSYKPKEKTKEKTNNTSLDKFLGKIFNYNPVPHTKEEYFLLGTCIGAQALDYYTTKRNFKKGYTESNPLLGKNPSNSTLLFIKIGIPIGSFSYGQATPKNRKYTYGMCTGLGIIPALINLSK